MKRFIGLLVLFGLAACRSAAVVPEVPALPMLEAGTWTQFTPGGDSICSDGSDYAYFAIPGSDNKVVIDFQGGGACWEAGSCAAGIFEPTVTAADAPAAVGIYDRANASNPVKDWYHVLVPYCTADVHWGNNVASYASPAGGELVIHHKGAVNARAVLDWVFAEFEAPDSIFVTGCSAGAYGSIMWLAEVKAHYPEADVYQLGDCGAGIATQAFADGGLANWNISGALPRQVPGFDPDAAEFNGFKPDLLTDLYSAVADFYPDVLLSQFNTVFDGTQIAFYGLMKGELQPSFPTASEWATRMLQSLATIDAASDNFVSFTSTFDDDNNPANGTAHCIITRPEFYTVEQNGRNLTDWLGDLLSGQLPSTVTPVTN